MIDLHRDGDVHILQFGEGDHRFSPAFLDTFHDALDQLEAADGPAALVTTAVGKIWHNGLDLDHLATLGDRPWDYIDRLHHLLARCLTLPMPTVAAVQGHAFAGGAMLALAHDVRTMRADRGFLCLPEIDLGMPFSPGMAAMIGAKLPQPALHRLAVLGERIGGDDALTLGVVDDAIEGEHGVLTAAIERARSLAGKASVNLVEIRRNYYGRAIELLMTPSV